MESLFAARCCPVSGLYAHTNCWIRSFAPSCFQALKVGLFFGPVSLGPPFGKSQKMSDLGVLAAFVVAGLCGHLWTRCLREDVVQYLGFKRILIVRSDHLRRAVRKPLKSACFSGQFPLVLPLENLRKWAIWVSLQHLS